MINNKYKTVMCKHFEQTGQCYMGAKCHFAHGQEELRGMNDPLPASPIPGNTPSRQPGNFPRREDASAGSGNYKTVKCRFFEKGLCKHNQNCSFAHGNEELRQSKGFSGDQRGGPSGMSMQNMMQPMYDPNLQNQVAFQQITLLANEMKEYHAKDKDLSTQINQAVEMNSSGNIQGAAAVLYSLMDRPNKTKQDSEHYETINTKMQQLGASIYQTYQMQQYSQQMISPQMDYNPMSGYGGMGGYNQGYSGQRYQSGNGSYQGQDGNRGGRSQQDNQYGSMNSYNNYGGHQGQHHDSDNQGQY